MFRTNVDCGDKDDIETEPEVLEPKVSKFSNFRLLIFDCLLMIKNAKQIEYFVEEDFVVDEDSVKELDMKMKMLLLFENVVEEEDVFTNVYVDQNDDVDEEDVIVDRCGC